MATELCRGTIEDFFHCKYDGLEKKIICERDILRHVTRGNWPICINSRSSTGIYIKPTNILIFQPEGNTSKPLMKVVDLDISKILKLDRKDFTNTSMKNPPGSRGWMAPEVNGSNRFDYKIDIWAFGCIFGYALSGGKHIFGDDSNVLIGRINGKEPMLLNNKDFLITNKKF